MLALATLFTPGSAAKPTAPVKLFSGPSLLKAAPSAVPSQLLVRYKSGVSERRRAMLRSGQNARLIRRLLLPRTELVTVQQGKSLAAARAAFERQADVAYAEPNYVRQVQSTFPSDTNLSELWGLHNFGQSVNGHASTADADIDAPEGWEKTTGSSSVVVGVADTGTDYMHPDLSPNIWANPGESGAGKETNGIDDDANGKIDDFRGWDFFDNDNDPQDSEGHGTHVTGTLGGRGDDGYGVTGVAWRSSIAPLRVCDPTGCTDAAITDAFTYAGQKGMNVVNASLGGDGPASQALDDAITAAPSTLFVVVSGNGGPDEVGDDDEAVPFYPCDYTAANLICVAATDQNDGLTSFSNYGATSVDLGAPGENVLSDMPGGSFGYLDGTSMAAPLVSGAAALLFAASPGASVGTIRSEILSNVDAKSGLSGKVVTGGRLNLNAALPPPVSPPPGHGGDLDTSFDGDGKVVTDFGSVDQAQRVAIRDGQIVVVGTSGTSAADFALARYNSDGSLDMSFSGDGKVLTDFGGGDQASAVAIQADGKIVVAGLTNAGANPSNFALARYNSDGSLDTSFDGDGRLLTDFGASDSANGVAIQADGKIVTAGSSNSGANPGNFALARYNSDGSLDTSFDGDGRLLTDFGAPDVANDVAIQADGKLMAAGQSAAGASPDNFALARYNPNGSLDATFDGDGKTLTDFGGVDQAHRVAIRDGQIVAVGSSGTSAADFALARYNPDGSLDTSFSGDGKVLTDFGTADFGTAVAIQVDGRIVAAGLSNAGANPQNFALARYDSNGSLDATFDGDGKALTDFGGGDSAAGVAIQADGRIVAAGSSAGNFALARYSGNTFTVAVSPNAELNPQGANVTVTGTGWPVGSAVALSQCSGTTCRLLTTPTADAGGGFSVPVSVNYTNGLTANCDDPDCHIRAVSGLVMNAPISFKAPSSTVTTPSDGAIALGRSIAVGESVTDTAAITGDADSSTPSGTVNFYVCGPAASPATCASISTPLAGNPKTLTAGAGNTATATSDAFAPAAPGRYCLHARYSGSAKYRSSSDSSRVECISVRAADQPVTAANDYWSTAFETPLNVPAAGVLQNDPRQNGTTVTAQLVSGPTDASSFTLNANGSFSYTPNASFSGSDSFTYRAQDSNSNLSNVATVTIEVSSEPYDVFRRNHFSRRNFHRRKHFSLNQASLTTFADCSSRFVWVNPQVTLKDPTSVALSAALYDGAGNRLLTSDGYLAYGDFFGDPFQPVTLSWPVWETPAPAGGFYVQVTFEANPGTPDAYTETNIVSCVT